MYSLAIHGSCVSRDFAEFEKWPVVNYQARSSLSSKTGTATQYDKKLLARIESKFQRRMVEWDMASHPFRTNGADVVLIDLIDERFDIFTHGLTVSTRSQAYHQAGIRNSIPETSKRIERGSEEHIELFTLGVKQFSKGIDKPVILHDARWSETYRLRGELLKFEDNLAHIVNNKLLDEFTEILIDEMSLFEIVASPDLRIADPEHKWGLAPFHYIPEYYSDIGQKISMALSKCVL